MFLHRECIVLIVKYVCNKIKIIKNINRRYNEFVNNYIYIYIYIYIKYKYRIIFKIINLLLNL